MKYLIWLDDERNPYKNNWMELYAPEFTDELVIWVKNYDEFVNWIEEHELPNMVAFDHDLGENSKSGYEAAKWLVDYVHENNFKFPKYTIQSSNPVGAQNIKSYIENAKKMIDI